MSQRIPKEIKEEILLLPVPEGLSLESSPLRQFSVGYLTKIQRKCWIITPCLGGFREVMVAKNALTRADPGVSELSPISCGATLLRRRRGIERCFFLILLGGQASVWRRESVKLVFAIRHRM